MRILMLTQFYPPYIGGIEKHVRNLSLWLAQAGHSVAVGTLWREGLPEEEEDGPVRIYRLRGTVHRAAKLLFTDPQRVYAPPLPDPELVRGLRWIVRRERPQIVHGHNWLVHSYLPLKRWSKAPLVVTMHDYALVCANWSLLYKGVACDGPGLRKCLDCGIDTYGVVRGAPTVLANWATSAWERRLVDTFVPVSQAVADGVGLPRSGLPYRVIHNFAPDEIAHEGEQADADPELASYMAQLPAEPFLLFIGAFDKHKGVDVLLKSYGELRDPPPLVMIGYRHSGYRLPTEGVGGRLVVLEHWPHAAVMGALRRSLFLVEPSVYPDPCPTVAIEAMAAGRAAVASRIGGLTDLVADGVTGVLVEPGNPAAWRAAMEAMLADTARREAMCRAARLRFPQFGAGAIVPRIEGLYQELEQEGHRR